METSKLEPINGCHVVAMPFPGRGHINPMISFCTFLLPSPKVSTVTLVLTEEWLGLISHQLPAAAGSPKLRIRTIPNVLPSELTRGANLADFYRAVYTKMEAPFEALLIDQRDRLEPPVSCIVADVFLKWMVGLGRRRDIPVVAFWTQPPSVFSVFYHFDLLAAHGHFSAESLPGERHQEIIDYLPGVLPMSLADLPSVIFGNTRGLNYYLEAFSHLPKAQSVVLTSFYELQPDVTNSLRTHLPIPIYTIGPSIPLFSLKTPYLNPTPSNEEGYMSWLNSHPDASILYVSLGSYLSTSKNQIMELAMGLEASGARYLWIVRDDHELGLKATCGERGLMVSWCDQLMVLCHRSIAGFLTHCGWNSTMESIFAGVPILTFPLGGDQILNSKIVVEDLGVGVKLKKKLGLENIVGRDEIAEAVKRFMNLDGNEGKEMRRKAKELQETCHKAIDVGGSTSTNVTAFVESICTIRI